MPSATMQIHGPVKKSGDRIAVHGVSFSVLEGESFGLWGPRVEARPWSFAKSYTNFTQILRKSSLSLLTFPPYLPYPAGRTMRHVPRGRVHMRRTSGPPPSLAPHWALW